jgi:hypothetical protein
VPVAGFGANHPLVDDASWWVPEPRMILESRTRGIYLDWNG